MLTIVGEAPGRNESGIALGRLDQSGSRLARAMGVADVRDVARVINLLGFWPGPSGKGSVAPRAAMREAAAALMPDLRGDVILLGRRVAAAFGIPGQPFLRTARYARCSLTVVPHPSGVNYWWNDDANTRRARRTLRRIVRNHINETENAKKES